jgi:hypothetical protein
LFSGLPTQFHNFLLKFLATLQSLLFNLLPAGGKVLLLFGDFGLNLLFNTGTLLACCLKQLLALLSGLIAEVIYLTLGLLPNRGTVNELLPLALRLLNDLFGLLPCRIDEVIPGEIKRILILNKPCLTFLFILRVCRKCVKWDCSHRETQLFYHRHQECNQYDGTYQDLF